MNIDHRTQPIPAETQQSPVRRRFALPSLGLRVSERRLLLLVVDVLLMSAALLTALAATTDLLVAAGAATLLISWKWLATLIVVWLAAAFIFDVYNLARAAGSMTALRAVMPAAALAAGVYLIIPWLTPPLQSRSQGFIFVILAVLFLALWRSLYALLFTQPSFQRRALVVGAGDGVSALTDALRGQFDRGGTNPFRGTGSVLLGIIADDQPQEAHAAGLPLLGPSRQLVRLARSLQADEVILALPPEPHRSPDVYEALLDCRELGIPIVHLTTVYERLTGRVPVAFAAADMDAVLGARDNSFTRAYHVAKRLLDILFALVGTLVVLFLALPIALANAVSSRGPLFYYQQRIGCGGRPFRIVKFRSMCPDAENGNGPVWAKAADDRVTPVGKWLRRLHLDELPQVINVLRGEMSFVGPRPERPEFAGELAREIPFYRARHGARPGITGWAQIHQDYGSSVDDARVKLEYDLYYIKNAGLSLDSQILLRTVTKVLTFAGR